MRKLIAILISFMLLFSAVGCMTKDDEKNPTDNNATNQGGSMGDGTNGGGSGGFDNNTPGGNMGGGSVNNGGMNNNNMNGNMTNSVEDLTESERETLRTQIDSLDGITFNDIRFEGEKAIISVKNAMGEIGEDVKKSITDMVMAIRGGVREVEFAM
jgi:hypothetical protein